MQISMKGVLSGEIGYPLDISLSPDGTMLTGSYMYIEDGTLRSRVAFYNFSEVGKNALNRFVMIFTKKALCRGSSIRMMCIR